MPHAAIHKVTQAESAGRAPSLDADERAAWTGLFQLTQRLIAQVDLAFREHFDLGVADAELLFLLQIANIPPRVVELTKRVFVSQASVSRALARLDERGLVERSSAVDDARATHVTLTPAGRKLIHEMRALEEQVLGDQLFSHLDPDAVAGLLAVWRRVPWLSVDVTQMGRCGS